MNQKTLRFEGQVKKFFENFNKYYGHLVRTKSSKKDYLKNNEDWFGKRGNSYISIIFVYRTSLLIQNYLLIIVIILVRIVVKIGFLSVLQLKSHLNNLKKDMMVLKILF